MVESLVTASAAAAILLAAWSLYWALNRNASAGRAADQTQTRGASRLVSSVDLIDGSRRRRVTLGVTDSVLYYESSAIGASLELESILEIEYDTVTAAGLDVVNGRALRLRSEEGTLEFVLPRDIVTSWYRTLPPHPERVQPAKASTATPTIAPRTAPLVWHR